MRTESSSEEYAREVITKQSSYTPIVLTIEDLASIFKRLKSASNDWFTLGLAFGLKFSALKNIEGGQYPSNNRLSLRNMVNERLKITNPEHPMTWPYICECLRKPTVERNDVAEEIEGKMPIIILFNIACACIWDHSFLISIRGGVVILHNYFNP